MQINAHTGELMDEGVNREHKRFSFDTNSLQPTHKQMPRFIHKRRHTFVNELSYYMARAQINSAAWRDGLTVERATGHAQGLFYSKRKSKDAKEFDSGDLLPASPSPSYFRDNFLASLSS